MEGDRRMVAKPVFFRHLRSSISDMRRWCFRFLELSIVGGCRLPVGSDDRLDDLSSSSKAATCRRTPKAVAYDCLKWPVIRRWPAKAPLARRAGQCRNFKAPGSRRGVIFTDNSPGIFHSMRETAGFDAGRVLFSRSERSQIKYKHEHWFKHSQRRCPGFPIPGRAGPSAGPGHHPVSQGHPL